MEEETAEQKISEQLLRCSICFEPFKDPKILGCQHTFCLPCLESWIRQIDPNKRYIECPMCRKSTRIPHKGLRCLPMDLKTTQLQDLLQNTSINDTQVGAVPCSPTSKSSPRFCDICAGEDKVTPAMYVCEQCQDNLCAACVLRHSATPLFESHHVVNTSQDSSAKNGRFCNKHPNKFLQIYCATCDVPICSICVTSNHVNCELKDFQSLLEPYRNVYKKLLEQLDSSIVALEGTRDRDSARRRKLESRFDLAENAVISQFNMAMDCIVNSRNNLLSQIQSRRQNTLKAMDADADASTTRTTCMQSCKTYVSKVLQENTMDVARLYEDICATSKSLLSDTPQTLNKNDVIYVRFIPGSSSTWELGEIQDVRLCEDDFTNDHTEHNGLESVKKFRENAETQTDIHVTCGNVNAVNSATEEASSAQPSTDSAGDDSPPEAPVYGTTLLWKLERSRNSPMCISLPTDMCFMDNGLMAVTDPVHSRLQLLDYEGSMVHSVGQDHIKPLGIANAGEGAILLTDDRDKCVKLYNVENRCLASLATMATESPCGVAVHKAGYWVVSDRALHTVSVLEPDGWCILTFGNDDRQPEAKLNCPYYVTSDRWGRILVSDCNNHAVKVFDMDGSFLFKVGGMGDGPGQLHQPHGIDTDAEGNIFVADCKNHRVSMFSPDGIFLQHIVGSADGILGPVGLAIAKALPAVAISRCNKNNPSLSLFDLQALW